MELNLVQIELNKKIFEIETFFIVTVLILYTLISWILGTSDEYYFDDTSNIGSVTKR